ncbi:BES1/BZR1 homolog protein 4 [Linum perenne]
MTSGTRMPTWKERENNKRRERRRRAIAAKIYTGLRMYGNYKLPKHCDNNEVLKALCQEAGWIVEEDGTTYRKGCRPVERMDIMGGGSASASPCSSYQPSPASSSFPSPISSHYTTNATNVNNADANSLIPWLKNLSSSHPHNLYIHTGSISAPVTPPLSSPTAQSPRHKQNDWVDDHPSACPSSWMGQNYPFLPSSSMPSSTPQSPGRHPDSSGGWLPGMQSGPTSPTFSLVARNQFDTVLSGAGSRMWTPGQSGTCSPAVFDQTADVPMADSSMVAEFAFGSSSSAAASRLVKPWEGERIHEELISDDLELTLGSSKTR